MGKKILVLSGSPRKGGNSDYLCDRFIAGAQEAGHEAAKIFISGKKVGYCRACYACKNTGKCVQKDDMEEILAKMLAADVLVLASPVYFYSIDAQIKTVLDRTLARWTELGVCSVPSNVSGASRIASGEARRKERFSPTGFTRKMTRKARPLRRRRMKWGKAYEIRKCCQSCRVDRTFCGEHLGRRGTGNGQSHNQR